MDERYPEIIKSCAYAMSSVRPGNRVWIGAQGKGCVGISMYWNHWPCLFPQHGLGRKHAREIALATWQVTIVHRHPQPLIKGLIHSDGCRIVANDRGVRSVRYHFSNRSEDIKRIYCESLDVLGIPWTRPCDTQIAVYRKSAVAAMDEFIGPKR